MERNRIDALNLDALEVPEVSEEVRDAMLPWLGRDGARPEGLHAAARRASQALAAARESVAALFGASPERLVFTSSAAEALCRAARAAAALATGRERGFAYPAHESDLVAGTARAIAAEVGVPLDPRPVDSKGRFRPWDVPAECSLLALSWAHPTLGTVQELPAIAERSARAGAVLAVDATPCLGRIRLDADALEGTCVIAADLAPIGVPRGVGAAVFPEVIASHPLPPTGAIAIALAVGAGLAARRASEELHKRADRLRAAARALLARVLLVDGVIALGPEIAERLPGHVAVAVPHLRTDALILALSDAGVLASLGSACGEAGVAQASLVAAGHSMAIARSTVVFALSATAPLEGRDLDRAAHAFAGVVRRLSAVAGRDS